jgi:predicted permease
MADELEAHLALHIDDNVRAGMSAVEARRQALLKFGPVEGVKDAYRDRGGIPVVSHVARDVRYALRMLRKSPGFSATVILTTALAVGVNAAIFTLLNAAALRSLPVPDGDRLLNVVLRHEGSAPRGIAGTPGMLSYPEFLAVRDQSASAFRGVMAFAGAFGTGTLGGEQPRALNATLTSCEYFDVLRVRAALGRTFTAADCVPGVPGTIVLSDGLWRTAFSADPAVVGRTVTINRAPFVVIGVAAPGFTGTQLIREEAFVPLMFQTTFEPDVDLLGKANTGWLNVIVRLRDDASPSVARAALAVIAGRLTASGPPDRILHLDTSPATLSGLPAVRSMVLSVSAVIMAAVGLVLLIACANIANLLLARAATRRREIAVRLALGASRGRLIQQLLTESLLLASIGGAAGGVIGAWSSVALMRLLLANLPPTLGQLVFEPRPDPVVAAYAIALTAATAIAFGLLPAIQATKGQRLEVREAGSTERPGARRLQQVLVAVQLAVSVVLVLSAGLLTRGLYRAHTIDPGLNVNGVTLLAFDLRSARYSSEAAAAFQQQAIARLRAVPGVRLVAQAGSVPLSDMHAETRFFFPGTELSRYLEFSQVSADYFAALDLSFVKGRTFTDSEIASERALIVTESTARRLWPDQDPLAQALLLDKTEYPVVGVIKDAQLSRLGETDTPYVFLPAGPDSQARLRLLVAAAPGAVSPRVLREAIASIDPQLAIDVTSLADTLAVWRAPSWIASTMAVALALLALVLACTGVFGTVAYTVSRRVREIGIRVALGAAHDDIVRLIVRQGMRPVAAGIALGIAGAAAVSSLLGSMLFGLSPHDPIAFVAVTALLGAIALLACYVPARRALRVEPTTALRVE